MKKQQVKKAVRKGMNAEQAGRLLTLAYFLKTQVCKKELDMGVYCRVSIGNNPLVAKNGCGTSACALGWSTAVFPEKFRLKVAEDYSLTIPVIAGGISYSYSVIDRSTGAFAHCCSTTVMEWFGISEDEASDLFGTRGATPASKAKQIEDLVARHGYVYK